MKFCGHVPHPVKVCQHGYTYWRCRCPGPHQVVTVEVCPPECDAHSGDSAKGDNDE